MAGDLARYLDWCRSLTGNEDADPDIWDSADDLFWAGYEDPEPPAPVKKGLGPGFKFRDRLS